MFFFLIVYHIPRKRVMEDILQYSGKPALLAISFSVLTAITKAHDAFGRAIVISDNHSIIPYSLDIPDKPMRFITKIDRVFGSDNGFIDALNKQRREGVSELRKGRGTVLAGEYMKKEKIKKLIDVLHELEFAIEDIKYGEYKTQKSYMQMLVHSGGWDEIGSPEEMNEFQRQLALSEELMSKKVPVVMKLYSKLLQVESQYCKLNEFIDLNYELIELLRRCGFDPSRSKLDVGSHIPIPETSKYASLLPKHTQSYNGEMTEPETTFVIGEAGLVGYDKFNLFQFFDNLRAISQRISIISMHLFGVANEVLHYNIMNIKKEIAVKPLFVYYANLDEVIMGKSGVSDVPFPKIDEDMKCVLSTFGAPVICVNKLINEFLAFHSRSSSIITKHNPLENNPVYVLLKKKIAYIIDNSFIFVSASFVSGDDPTKLILTEQFESTHEQVVVHKDRLEKVIDLFKYVTEQPPVFLVWRIVCGYMEDIYSIKELNKGAFLDYLISGHDLGTHISTYRVDDSVYGPRKTLVCGPFMRSLKACFLESSSSESESMELFDKYLQSSDREELLDKEILRSGLTYTKAFTKVYGNYGALKVCFIDSFIDAAHIVRKVKMMTLDKVNPSPETTCITEFNSLFLRPVPFMDEYLYVLKSLINISEFWSLYIHGIYRELGINFYLDYDSNIEFVCTNKIGKGKYITVIPHLPDAAGLSPQMIHIAELISMDVDILLHHILEKNMYSVVFIPILCTSIIGLLMQLHYMILKTQGISESHHINNIYLNMLFMLEYLRFSLINGKPPFIVYSTYGDPLSLVEFEGSDEFKEHVKHEYDKLREKSISINEDRELKIKDKEFAHFKVLLGKSGSSIFARLISIKEVVGVSTFEGIYDRLIKGEKKLGKLGELDDVREYISDNPILIGHSSQTVRVNKSSVIGYRNVTPKRFEYDLRFNRTIMKKEDSRDSIVGVDVEYINEKMNFDILKLPTYVEDTHKGRVVLYLPKTSSFIGFIRTYSDDKDMKISFGMTPLQVYMTGLITIALEYIDILDDDELLSILVDKDQEERRGIVLQLIYENLLLSSATGSEILSLIYSTMWDKTGNKQKMDNIPTIGSAGVGMHLAEYLIKRAQNVKSNKG